jgi:hypothetical protein
MIGRDLQHFDALTGWLVVVSSVIGLEEIWVFRSGVTKDRPLDRYVNPASWIVTLHTDEDDLRSSRTSTSRNLNTTRLYYVYRPSPQL